MAPGSPLRDKAAAIGLLLFVVFLTDQIHASGNAALGLIVGAAIASLALIGWVIAHRQTRSIADLPISRVASAPQGYVALVGRARALGGVQTFDPVTALPCLWYSVSVTRRDGDERETINYCSDDSFLIDDRGSTCLLEPIGAQVIACHSETFVRDKERITRSVILSGDLIYVQGHFRTLCSDAVRNETELAREVISDWKRDPDALHKRFDLDSNGEIDQQEWALARAAALREARRQKDAAAAQPEISAISIPSDVSRSFLVSALPRAQLLQHYRRWRAVATLCLLAGSGLIGWGMGGS